MFGFDIAVALLIVGILVLCTTTAASILPGRGPTAPTNRQLPAPRAAQARQAVQRIEATHRRAVTGHPASLERLALTVGRPDDLTTDSQSGAISDVDAAEALIDRLLQTDPELVAALMTQWIRQDATEQEASTVTSEFAGAAEVADAADTAESAESIAPSESVAPSEAVESSASMSPHLAALFTVGATAAQPRPSVDPDRAALDRHLETH